MYFRDVNGTDKLCIYKKGRNTRDSAYNIKHKIVSNFIIGIIGGTGSGKSVFMNLLSNELNKDCGYTEVYVTEKVGEEFANAVCAFEPKEQYHLNLLNLQNQVPKIKPIKLYHHFSFNIPYKKKMPPIQWFVTSVKNLNSIKLDAIMPTESEKAILLCYDVSSDLNNDENMYDFLWKVFLKTRDDLDYSGFDAVGELFTPSEAVAGQVTIKNIKQGLKVFNKDWFLHEHRSPYKLDYIRMLNDNTHTHFLSTKWLSSKKSKLLAIIDFLIGIDDALKSGKVKRKIVINLEELKTLIPGGNLTRQQELLLDILYDLLSRIRTKAFVIGTMQSLFDINLKFRGLFSKIFLGKLNFNDLRILIKDLGFRVEDQQKLLGLSVGEFLLWESQDNDNEKTSSKIVIDVPTFANAEEGDDFFNLYAKHYPDKMQNNLQFYSHMKNYKKQIEKLAAKRLLDWQRNQKKLKDKKSLKKEGKIDEIKQVLKEEKKSKIELIMKQVYNMKNENPNYSWRKIARKIDGIKTYNTAQKYYERMKHKMRLIESAPKLD